MISFPVIHTNNKSKLKRFTVPDKEKVDFKVSAITVNGASKILASCCPSESGNLNNDMLTN